MTHKYTCKKCCFKWVKFLKVDEEIKCPSCGSKECGRVATPQFNFASTTDKYLRGELGEDI